jgi:beta-glucosidase
MQLPALPRRLVALVAVGLLGLSPLHAVESATEPAERTGGPADRFKLLNERVQAANGVCDILFIGDSITQGWEGAGKPVWDQYYAGRKALNIGIGGDKTQHLLWRFENGNLAGLKPKVAVLMIGTNNSGEERNNSGDIVAGITKVVQALRTRLPETKILLLGIFPRGQNFNFQRGQLTQINQTIRKLADGDKVHWLDFGHEFLAADGTLPREIMPDYLHLSEQGYRLWAESMEDTLVRLLGGSKGAAMSSNDLTGEWSWTTAGPDGNPVTGLIELKLEGTQITGRFARDETRWLEIQDGELSGDTLKWTVKRDRPGGGTLTYRMTGTLKDGKITGMTATEFDGNPIQSPWTAERKK